MSQASNTVSSIVEQLRGLIKKGMIQRLVVSKNGKTIIDVPVNAGVVSLFFFSRPTLVAVVTAFLSGCDLSIETEGKTVDGYEFLQEQKEMNE